MDLTMPKASRDPHSGPCYAPKKEGENGPKNDGNREFCTLIFSLSIYRPIYIGRERRRVQRISPCQRQAGLQRILLCQMTQADMLGS